MQYGCADITINTVNVSSNPFRIFYGCLKENLTYVTLLKAVKDHLEIL